jgi:hypothetical protein
LQAWDFVTGLTAESFTGAALWEQRVSSYESSVFIKLIERVGKWIAYALIIFGLLSLWVYSREKKEKQQPEVKTEQSDKKTIRFNYLHKICEITQLIFI